MKFSLPLFRLTIASFFILAVVCNDLTFGQRRGNTRKSSPSRAAGIVEEADKLADDKKWPEAIDAYKLAIRLDANYAPAHSGLGGAYMNMGNWKEALAAYNEQVRVAPNDSQAQYDLGFFYNAMGRHGDAFAPLVKAVSLDPSFAEAHYEIGYAYVRIDDFEKSLAYLRNAVRLRPDYADAYYSLGLAYARLGKPDLANEQIKKLATIDARLSRKLEKDLQAPATTNQPATVANAPGAPVISEPATQPSS